MTLVIFDVDATLVYSDKLDSKAFAQTYHSIYQQPFPSIDWKTYPHVTDDTIFKTVIQQHFQRQATVVEIEIFKTTFTNIIKRNRQKQPTNYKIVSGAKEMIATLLEQENIVLGIATGGWKAPAMLKLRHVEIPTASVFISGADGKTTRVQIIEEVIAQVRQAGISYSRIVYVGDAIWDVKTTRQMQLPLIGIRYKGDVEVLRNEGVRHVLTDYQNLSRFRKMIDIAVPPNSIHE